MNKTPMEVSDEEQDFLSVFHNYRLIKRWLNQGSPSYTEAQRIWAKTFCGLVELLLTIWRAMPKAMRQEVVDKDEKQ